MTSTVTVLGLGEMGGALAAAFLAGGHRTTVWNRTAAKADALVAKGARRAGSVRQAVAAGELVVVSVQGNATVREVLESAGDALEGRAVLNLTDGTSQEARAVADWVREQGAAYLHGQIMTIAPGVGGDESVVFYGGSSEVHDRHEAVLRLIGGRGTLIGTDAGAPTLYGMAVHGTMWGMLNGFLHAAALLSSEGITTKQFLEQANPAVTALIGHLPMLGDEVDSKSFATPYGALRSHRPSLVDLISECAARGLGVDFPEYTLGLVDRAIEQGRGGDSYARLVEHFQKN
ncbi:NAD(P)-dependent oxidoreductase [Streptomyces sp. NPDC053560]|uniref:NAD(P)-dependent oxidoreductase n=1 Tax=Streptomyces sp. NPDC053560 TaxID=3365711 RepID=UPI0037D0F854